LVELLIAMTLLALIAVSLYGLVSVGAKSAGSGERKSEQSRRLRIATGLIVRQLHSAAPEFAIIDEAEGAEAQPYFLGESDRLEFVTTSAQGPLNTGLALVSYWQEGEVLMMSELPYFLAFTGDRLDGEFEHMTMTTPLLYDVRDVRFEYQRGSGVEEDAWEESWDASYESELPATVRISIEPAHAGGWAWHHEIPVFVGLMNEITGEEDFQAQATGPVADASRDRRRNRQEAEEDAEGEDGEEEDDEDLDEEDLEE
jgi:hypothetical protein